MSPAVADSEPRGKLEFWLWCGTPAHNGGAGPSVSATARGRRCKETRRSATAKPLSPQTLRLGRYSKDDSRLLFPIIYLSEQDQDIRSVCTAHKLSLWHNE